MAHSRTGAPSVRTDTVTGVVHETHSLVSDVGPAWGLGIVVAICIFMPRIGVFVQLAKLFKEDRADARKHKLESQRLLTRYQNRPKPPVKKGGPNA
jgi:hypothetical protein